MAHSPAQIANYLLSKSFDTGRPLTPMQIIKLVYIAHGWHLAIHNDKPLITDAVEAWKFGPVISSLYRRMKDFGGNVVTSLLPHNRRDQTPALTEETRALLDSVWEGYSHLSGPQLSTLTHRKGTAWYETWHQQGGNKQFGAIIPDQLISKHFRELLEKAPAA